MHFRRTLPRTLIVSACVAQVCAAQSIQWGTLGNTPIGATRYSDVLEHDSVTPRDSKNFVQTIGGGAMKEQKQKERIVDDPNLFWSVKGVLAYVVRREHGYVLRYGDMDVFLSPFPIKRMMDAPEDALYVYSEFETNEGTLVTVYFDGENQSLVPGGSVRLGRLKGETVAITTEGVFWQSGDPKFVFPKDRYIYHIIPTDTSLAYMASPTENALQANPKARVEAYVGEEKIASLPLDSHGSLHMDHNSLMYTSFDQVKNLWTIHVGKRQLPETFPTEPWIAPYQTRTYTYADQDLTRWIVHGKDAFNAGYHITPLLGESDRSLYWIGRKFDSLPVSDRSKVIEDTIFKDKTKLLSVFGSDPFFIDFRTVKLILGKPALVLRSERGRGDAVWYNGAIVLKGERIIGIAERRNTPVALIGDREGTRIVTFRK
jgi:hypothetical protein